MNVRPLVWIAAKLEIAKNMGDVGRIAGIDVEQWPKLLQEVADDYKEEIKELNKE